MFLGHVTALKKNLWSSNLSSASAIRTAELSSPDEFLLCIQEVNGDKVLALETSCGLPGGSDHDHVNGHRPSEQQTWDIATPFIFIKISPQRKCFAGIFHMKV